MGTELLSTDDAYDNSLSVTLKRYWGGNERGRCYQITKMEAPHDYVQLTEKDMLFMLRAYLIGMCDDTREE